jgi:transposase
LEGLRQLLQRLEDQQLEPGDWPLVRALVSHLLTRTQARQERMLAKIAAAGADAVAEEDASGSAPASDGSNDAGEAKSSPVSCGANAVHDGEPAVPPGGDDDAGDKGTPPKPQGHGRNGVAAYRTVKDFFHKLAAGVIGALCPRCEAKTSSAADRMYGYREKVIIRVIGQPLLRAEAHHHEQARCRICGYLMRAQGPAEVHEGIGSDYVRYDWSACALLMVMHYAAGAPFKRLESLHESWGIPLSDANQWSVVNAGDDFLLPLFKALERHAIAKATNYRMDDTGSMVVSIQKQIDAEIAALERLGESTKGVRTGINATGFYWETPDGPIILYYTGRHHAGEVVDQLLRRRLLSSPKLVQCTDGASKNFDHEHRDKVVEATCNAHALLKFRDLRDQYPAEYAEAGAIYHQVFENDDTAKDLGLTPLERMLYHREHSKPLMEQLKATCEQKLKSKLCEPNSPLWEPVTFVINQWQRLTRFCEVPGVPLDTNLIEQALIMPVRYLAGSFNYQTETGAEVGDRAMSLIATARAQGVEPVAYLTDCLRQHEDLAQRPEHYLPWAYRERTKAGDSPPSEPARAPSPSQPPPAYAGSPRTLRNLAPEVREGAALRVAAPDQNLELPGQQG